MVRTRILVIKSFKAKIGKHLKMSNNFQQVFLIYKATDTIPNKPILFVLLSKQPMKKN